MRIALYITTILFNLQCFSVGIKSKLRQKTDSKNSVQTVKYQEHRDVSLLYGATKDLEDSGHVVVNDFEGSGEKLIPDFKTTRKTRKHHLKGLIRFPHGRNVSATKKETVLNNNNNLIQHQDRGDVALTVKVHHVNLTKPKRITHGIKSHVHNTYRTIKKHKIPTKSTRHGYTTRKRTNVEDDLSDERQTISKTLNSIDDIQGSYSRGLDIDGMDIKEVNMIDNRTLSDYFHALNDNSSDSTNNNNYEYTPTPTQPAAYPKLAWDDGPSSSNTDENSGNDDFYDAIDRGDEPPPIKMKKVRPTKSHFNKMTHKSNKDSNSMSANQHLTSSSKFRLPSQEDFENFFRGMLDHFGHGRNSDNSEKQSEAGDDHHESLGSQRNMTAFLDAHGSQHQGDVTKLVSLGDPEVVQVPNQTQHDNMESDAEANAPVFNDEQVGRDGEGLASFLPPPGNPNTWTGPLDNKRYPSHDPLLSPNNLAENAGNPTLTWRMPHQQHEKQVNPNFARQQEDSSPSIPPLKGTRIMGGKISGGQISGGLIQGGQIKAGSIEGGIIKGGQVTGGRITNGTMEGGVISKGQMLGGHLVDGRLEGGKLLGGNVFGGRILGGSVEGGNIKGGVVAGGRFRGGNMQGGLLKGGEIQSGIIKGGKVEGGILHGGNIEGGELKFGDISGGTLKAGSMLGGQLKNGTIEGGTLKGGTIEGGVLKGGVMEGGQLKGGLVLAGKIKGGVIEGGVIEGGEIGDGVIIRDGKVNATIIGTGSSIDKNQRLGGLFKQGENSQRLGLKLDQQKHHLQSVKAVHQSKAMSDSATNPPTHIITTDHGLKTVNPNFNVKVPLREGTLKMLPQENDSTDDDDLEKLLSEGKSAGENTPELSSQRFFEEQDQPSLIQKKGSKQHHVVLDGVGFDLPNEDFVDLIDKMKHGPEAVEDLVNYYEKPNTKEHLKIGRISKATKISTSPHLTKIEHIKPEDLEKKLSSPTKPRSSVTRSDRDKNANNEKKEGSISASSAARNGKIKALSFSTKDAEKLRPTYHWSLNKLIKDRIPGSPGPAIRTHGEMRAIRGGLHLNGHNAWLGAGDFSGGCISDPDTCDDGLSFEMTFRLDKDALKYNDMKYIVDSGASTFNSKGFTLYTVQGNLRADLAVANKEFCVQIPLIVQRWQDVLVTWKKSEGMKMYVNCELKAHSKGSEHCIGCHSHGCHVTDTNTLLMIGRPNYSPHFHCTKFDSGDISFWERHLSANDVETLCGAPTGEISDSEKDSASHPTTFQETSQLALSPAPLNQASFRVNPVQSYIANQPYFNQFTGLVTRANGLSHQLFTAWSMWSPCSKTCGVGFRVRKRSCINPRLFPNGGLCNGLSIQHQSCFDRACPAYTQMIPSYNPLAFYSGFHFPQIPSVHSGTETALVRALTVDGGYSDWSEWGTCDRSCGGGAQVRTRICNNPIPSGGGKMCHSLGPAIQVRRCNRHGCPVDGGYSEWSGFGPCSKTCGSGRFQRRMRTCTNPVPLNGGKPCFGQPVQTRACSIRRCPVDGGYSLWSPWLPCDADCGGGIQERNRFCNHPAPQIGGKDCTVLGSDKQTRLCNLFPCNVNFQ